VVYTAVSFHLFFVSTTC